MEEQITWWDLTQEELELKIKHERKERFKKLNKYIQSDEFKEICSYFRKKWEDLTDEIRTKLQERTETKTIKSQLDRDVLFQNFLKEVKEQFGSSEWEEILKLEFQESINNVETHIFNKIEELYDAPVYSEIDIIKQIRIDYLCVDQRIKRIMASYADWKEEKISLHPYEELKSDKQG